MNKMNEVKNLVACLAEEIKLVASEKEATELTQLITYLRDYAESKRRALTQVRMNTESLQRADDSVNKSFEELDKLL